MVVDWLLTLNGPLFELGLVFCVGILMGAFVATILLVGLHATRGLGDW